MERKTEGTRMRVALIALATLALTAPAGAQRSAGRVATGGSARHVADQRLMGLTLGVHTIAAPGITISGEDMDPAFKTNLGPGLGLMVGYGFNPVFSTYASLDLAKQGSGISELEGSFGLAHFEVGARANLPTGSLTTIPYINASIGHRAVGARVTADDFDGDVDLSFSGTMFGIGGGMQHFISPKVALDGGVEFALGKFGKVEADGDSETLTVNGTNTIRLRFGINWRP